MDEAVVLYNKYVGDWGGTSTSYRFEAIDCDKDGKNEVVVKTLTKQPMTQVVMTAKADHVDLKENHTYDVAAVRIMAKDEFDNVLPFFNDLVSFETSGPIEIIGPKTIALQGGMGGTYVRTNPVAGKEEKATLYIHSEQSETIKIEFTVSA
ncbi:MAG: glycoside hydrolase family 2 protein, partial [Lachnospiraceae bacterium]|nr:glycoside hydrolase family 2 protein [Lachnospiraceae bacterium]